MNCLYFGYGSNLDAGDFGHFCARRGFQGARLIRRGTALLLDRQLVFDRHAASRRGGVLNLRDRPGAAVEGVLFEADARAGEALDAKEGVPHAYRRVECHAVLPNGSAVPAFTCIARGQGFHAPDEGYLAVVRRGLASHGLGHAALLAAARGDDPPPAVGHLFVYGTLLAGEANAGLLERLPREAAMARGVLHDCGDWPAMALGEGMVHGEVLPWPLERVAALDALEEALPHGAPGGAYRRTVLTVRTGRGGLRAYAYVVDEPHGLPVIPGGDWRRRG